MNYIMKIITKYFIPLLTLLIAWEISLVYKEVVENDIGSIIFHSVLIGINCTLFVLYLSSSLRSRRMDKRQMAEYLTKVKPMLKEMNNDIAKAKDEHKAIFIDMKRVAEKLWAREIEIDKENKH